MVENRVMIGVITGEYARRADFYDYFNMLHKPDNALMLFCHDRSPAHGRNMIIEEALKHGCTHVLFIDDDMAYKPNALEQLLEHDVDIVSGLYLSRAYPHQPLIFDSFDSQGRSRYIYLGPNEPRLKRITAAGLGFCLIKTEVFKKLKNPWIRLGELDQEQWCDDIGFFYRCWDAGFEVYCDTECCLGHMGTMLIWPVFKDGMWFSGYDTNGKNMLNTPQIHPEKPYPNEEPSNGID